MSWATQAFKRDGWVRPFFARYRTAMLASLALGVGALVFASLLMFAAGYLVDLSAERPEQGVWALFVPLAFVQVFGIGKPFLSYFERLASHDWVLRMSSELRRRLYRSIEGDAVFWTATHAAGEALGLLSEDIGHMQDLYLRTIFPQVVACIIWLLASFALGVFSPLLGLVTLLVVAVLVFVVPLVSVVVSGARRSRQAAVDARLYAEVYDDVSGVADWRFAQRGDEYVERVGRLHAEKAADERALSAAGRWRDLLVQFMLCAASIGILAWAALHFGTVMQDPAATGSLTRPADWIAAFALGFFPLVEAFSPLGAAAVQGRAHADSLERLNALDAAASAARPGRPAPEAASQPAPGGELRVEQLHFAYPGQREVLAGVDLAVRPGERLAVLGPSGAGKSTLLALLRGDLVPTQGQVLLGGVAVHELGDAVAQHVGVIRQDTYLFNSTLFENLALEDPDITEQQARIALERVGLGPLLSRLDDGLHTLVDEAGLRFSGGERHRIALARVLLRDTPVVLLDEPTVSLDPVTEASLLATVFEALEGRSVVMVTHHLLGVGHMDRVVFLEDGRVSLEGTPAQLERDSARFRQLLAFDSGA